LIGGLVLVVCFYCLLVVLSTEHIKLARVSAVFYDIALKTTDRKKEKSTFLKPEKYWEDVKQAVGGGAVEIEICLQIFSPL